MNPDIDLRIEELVLHRFPPGSHHAIGEALTARLAALLAKDGIPTGLSSADRIQANDHEMSSHGRPSFMGARLAETIYEGLS